MQNKRYIISLLILGIFLVACTPEDANQTPTLEATQTPFVLVVTATPSITPIPTQTFLPTPTALPTQTAPPPTPSILGRCALRTDWETYEVQAGDTLSNISVRTNTTVTTLQLANCIANANVIRVGQELFVPELPDDGEVVVEDLISNFDVNPPQAEAGDSITFTWTAEAGTVITIKYVTGNNVTIASNLAATGSLSFPLDPDLEVGDEVEFAINGIQTTDDGEILASPYSVFVEIIDEPEMTEEPETTEEPEMTEEPEVTEAPEATDEVEVTDEPEATEEVE